MLKEVKKLKDHLIMLQDENTLVATCLSNLVVVQENMGDKPIQAQKEVAICRDSRHNKSNSKNSLL